MIILYHGAIKKEITVFSPEYTVFAQGKRKKCDFSHFVWIFGFRCFLPPVLRKNGGDGRGVFAKGVLSKQPTGYSKYYLIFAMISIKSEGVFTVSKIFALNSGERVQFTESVALPDVSV